MKDTDPIAGLLVLILLIVLYFIPALVASSRTHHNRMAIFALNALLGWTVLGWIAAFVWSLTHTEPSRDWDEHLPQDPDEPRPRGWKRL